MTIDEAIKHCEKVAEQNEFKTRIYDELNRPGDEEYRNKSCQCAADHRQLAEWLRELKKAKRLLSSLLSDTNDGSCTKSCYGCKHWDPERGCDYSARYEWKHTDEVVKLIGGGENG